MAKHPSPIEDLSDREIIISRIIDAPRDLVWLAMTDPLQVVHWWGPRGFTTTIARMDVRPGGVWKHTMHGPDGTDYPNKSVFKEVVKPERIVYSHAGGRKGGPGATFVATWTFEVVENGKTKVTIRQVFASPAARDFIAKEFGAIEGGKQTLARLGEFLARAPLVIERLFAASVELVWNALTDLAQMKQWYFPQLESFEPVVGFQTQFNVHHHGKDFLHQWRVTEVHPGRKITYAWKYLGFPGESFVTFALTAEGGQTRLKLTHQGLETFQPDKYPDLAAANFLAGWTGLTDQLQGFVERSAVAAPRPPAPA